MKLQIGITKLLPGWETILKQIGVSFKEINTFFEIDLEEYVSIIVSDSPNKLVKERLLRYVNNGGTILTEADLAHPLFSISTKSTYIKYVHTHSDKFFPSLPECDIYSRCSIAVGANHLPIENNIYSALEKNIGKGKIFVFPSNISSFVHDSTIKRKNFYSRYSNVQETNERVAQKSKGPIRLYVQAVLENLFQFRNAPFVTLWSFPNGENNIFGFRIDTDFGTREEIHQLYHVCKVNQIRATWFVETASAGSWLDQFKEFNEQEIALHCFRHRTFKSYAKNFENISAGLAVLRGHGFTAEGFASPYGEWNENAGKAIENHSFIYSSEFGFAYDSLPLRPFFDGHLSRTLQIPIHPVSVGRLFAGGHSEETMIKYFEEIIEKKIGLREPIFFYTHPGEKRFSILDAVFKKVNAASIPNYTMTEFAEWWKRRESFTFNASIADGKLSIDTTQKDPTMRFRIKHPNGEVFLSDFTTKNKSKQKKLEIPETILNEYPDLNTLKRITLRMRWHDLLHTYRKMKQ